MQRSRTLGSAANSLSAIAVLALGLAGCSSGNVGDSFAQTDRVYLAAAGSWDRDRDGVVTCDEWKAYAGEVFTSADSNGDGKLESSEFPGVTKQDKMFETAGFAYYDSNGDGRVERVEFTEKPNRAFAILDKDRTCRLTSDQVAGARAMTRWSTEGKKPENSDPRDKPGGVPKM